ncbi:polymer-forming cytoskeletal protein [Myxococcota bacterium]|nr:polymer-forming cytoskeletal protein [Myxococcota bacterium]
MAIGNFSRTRSEEITSESEGMSPTVEPLKNGSGTLSAFIDQGSEFEGKLSFRDTVRIDGVFRGEIRSENTLVVGETGEIEADVTSGQVVISGSLIGNVRAEKGLVLHKTARVQGDVTAPSLIMEEGAVLNGSIEMAPPTSASSVVTGVSLGRYDDESPEED